MLYNSLMFGRCRYTIAIFESGRIERLYAKHFLMSSIVRLQIVLSGYSVVILRLCNVG